uniref:Uncharacterized protein n=1 Tax=Lysobacter sp. ATCC 53042 TaxID=324869 RepID=F8TUE6_9GAMM|nr:unknown [Lysobacter sp. ATCC 53042]
MISPRRRTVAKASGAQAAERPTARNRSDPHHTSALRRISRNRGDFRPPRRAPAYL